MNKATLLWIDLEMTGLDPERDKILEVAAIATDWEFNKVAEYTAAIKVDERLIQERMVGKFWEQNRESYEALVAQSAEGKLTGEVERELLKFVQEHFTEEGKILLCGNSIHQDRKFIDKEWSELAKKLHYRMLDVSAWKVYFEGALGKHFVKREAHRALDDIDGSIEELKYYLGYLNV